MKPRWPLDYPEPKAIPYKGLICTIGHPAEKMPEGPDPGKGCGSLLTNAIKVCEQLPEGFGRNACRSRA
ncbi:hypothetical protein, partial [Pseudoalteromonas sp. P1-9]|uniref:hypothetical protein n=1 Tax=Pseudoalteromonas sp. P1-9 TaxID=1710354 RepID=UPI001F35CB67